MVTIRPVRLPEDRAALLGLDRTFTTSRVYRVARADLSFIIEEVAVDPPIRKDFPLGADDLAAGHAWQHGLVAEQAAIIVGFAAFTHQVWNRRTEIAHLYVEPAARGQGIGRRLIATIATAAGAASTRCLWLETSSLAYPAIQFYRHLGFEPCGLDTSLYDPTGAAAGEMALYFSLPLPAMYDDQPRATRP